MEGRAYRLVPMYLLNKLQLTLRLAWRAFVTDQHLHVPASSHYVGKLSALPVLRGLAMAVLFSNASEVLIIWL